MALPFDDQGLQTVGHRGQRGFDARRAVAADRDVVGLGNAGVPAVAAMLSSRATGATRGMEQIDGPETIRRRVIFLDIRRAVAPFQTSGSSMVWKSCAAPWPRVCSAGEGAVTRQR